MNKEINRESTMRENENIAKSMLKIVDERISQIVRESSNFERLCDLYWSFGRDLTQIAGTMAGFTGLSEYIVLKTIIFFLEKELPVKFEKTVEKSVPPKKPANKLKEENVAKFFVSSDNNILITHSISINEGMEKCVRRKLHKEILWGEEKSKRPDIVIFRLKNDRYDPVAIVQVKIYQVNPDVINQDIKTLEKITRTIRGCLMIIVFFHEPSRTGKEKLNEFVKRNPDRAFVIPKSIVSENIMPKKIASFKEILNKIKTNVA